MRHYYVLTLHPRLGQVIQFVLSHQLQYELHLNRTRFWIPEDSPVLTEFLLRYADACVLVDDSADLTTGLTPS